ncbi:NADPH-dependent oxidoreductase [candidate division KSB1 bacterium]
MDNIMENPVVKTILRHSSVRDFQVEPIPDTIINTIVKCAIRAPTSSNLQAYSIIKITDPVKKIELARLAGDQKYIEKCPLFFAFCADIFRLRKVCDMTGVTMQDSFLELFLVASVDAALCCQNALITAESFGLGGVMIGGMRNNPKEVAELLKLPNGVYVVMGLCIGYPNVVPPVKPKLPLSTVYHIEEYRLEGLENLLDSYSKTVADTGVYKERAFLNGNKQEESPEYGWLQHTSRRLASKKPHVRRDRLRPDLEALGFSFK